MRKILDSKYLNLLECSPDVRVKVKRLTPIVGKEDRTFPAVCFEAEGMDGEFIEFTCDLAELRDFIGRHEGRVG